MFIQSVLITAQVTLLVSAVAGGSKLVQFGPFTFAATVFAYALTFLVTDLISEFYGPKAAKRAVICGFLSMVVALAFFQLAMWAPASHLYKDQSSYETVFGIAWRFVSGGLIAYLVSQFIDVHIFHRIRKLTKERFLWIRNNVSTMISQAIDTFIFISIAFYGIYDDLFGIYISQYFVKIIIAAIDTAVMYAIVIYVRKILLRERSHYPKSF